MEFLAMLFAMLIIVGFFALPIGLAYLLYKIFDKVLK